MATYLNNLNIGDIQLKFKNF